ncbi:MAG: IS1595 family transposase [Rhodobacteraceae bacterium]|nr:IS1595 family transposase [Paracoccaceae bacterium]
MARSVLNAPQFQTEAQAFEYVETRLWPNGPVCPHCGEADRVGRLNGKTTRLGLCKCYACKKHFTVRVGTIFESSHLPLHLWLQVIHLFCTSKKGISTRQIQRMLECSMKTAWFLGHRIREAMASNDLGPLGGAGVSVEVDETYITKSPKTRRQPGERTSTQILSLIERGGKQRSVFLDHRTIRNALHEHLDKESRLLTDGHTAYVKFMPLGQHESVDHSKREYVRGDVHVNTLEGFFSVFKRGLIGVYQHMDKKHLQRYLAEFDFRQNTREKLGINDTMRADIALQGVVGKRLTYQTARV